MSGRLAWFTLGLLALGCDAPAPAALEPPVAPSGSAAAPASSVRARPLRSARAASGPALAGLSFDAGRWRGQLGGRPIAIVLSTKQRPLAPNAPAAHFGLARLLAPDLVAPTKLHAIGLADLLRAAEGERERRALAESARVLADGSVRAALVELPAARLKSVDLGDLGEGRRAWAWESKLSTKSSPPEDQTALLASYQTLLAVDYVAANLIRREVMFDESQGRLLALEANDVFSAVPKEGAVGNGLGRLSGHLTYSKSLAERLAKLDKPAVEQALRAGPDRALLVTPKQLDEVIARKSTLERLIETRIKQRGRERALALP
jgi:hypothetical protein